MNDFMANVDAVIFDFDDTLVITNALFDHARTELFSAMRNLGLSYEEQWADFLDAEDIANVKKAGFFSADCFPRAMGKTYAHFATLSGLSTDPVLRQQMENIGWHVHNIKPRLTDGAWDVLSALYSKVRLFLFTQGDLELQSKRIKNSGLESFFNKCYIVNKKDKDSYLYLIQQQNIDCHCSWMVGNSIKSDINPAYQVGLQTVFYNSPSWDYEQESLLKETHTITHLKQLLELIY